MSKKDSSYYVVDIEEFIIINEKEYEERLDAIQRNYAEVRISERHEIINNMFWIPCCDGGQILFQVIGRITDKIILEFICTKGRGGI